MATDKKNSTLGQIIITTIITVLFFPAVILFLSGIGSGRKAGYSVVVRCDDAIRYYHTPM